MRGFLKLLIVLICGSLMVIWLPVAPSFAEDPPTYSLTAPETISFGDFTNVMQYEKTGLIITAYTDDQTKSKITINVEDTKNNTKGYLTLGGTDDNLKILSNPLNIQGGIISSYSPVTSTLSLVNEGNLDNGNYSLNFSVQQSITSDDLSKTAGEYKITLTFTAIFQ